MPLANSGACCVRHKPQVSWSLPRAMPMAWMCGTERSPYCTLQSAEGLHSRAGVAFEIMTACTYLTVVPIS